MPAQTSPKRTAYYVENDTAPPYRVRLEEDDGTPIDLTTAAGVTITIAYARWSFYYSPTAKIVDAFAVTIETPLTSGFVKYFPAVGHLTPPGAFLATFKITWNDATVQTIPSNTYLPFVIRTPVAGSLEGPP